MKKSLCLTLLMMAGCNREPEVKLTNATVDQVASKVREARAGETKLRPGQWQVVSSMDLLDVKGIPADQAARMKLALQRTSSNLQCVTKEQAERPNAGMFSGQNNGRCTYDNFEMAGGKISAKMRCPGQNGSAMMMTMDGTFAAETYEVKANMDVDTGATGQTMRMVMKSNGTRIGDCPAGEAKGG